MRNDIQVYFQYGLSILPVLVNAILEKRTGPRALRAFLKRAWAELEQGTQEMVHQRNLVNDMTTLRRERLAVNRYYDLDRRSRQALKLSLEALESFLKDRRKSWLDQALRQYDTSERFQNSKLRARMDLPPMICERISRAGEAPVAKSA